MGDRHHHHPGGGRPVYTLLLSIGLALLALLSEAQGCMDRAKTEEESGAGLLRRVKRGWVWNQFFVLEEYTGLEPLYIGKVSRHTQICMNTHIQTHTHACANAHTNTPTHKQTNTQNK